MSLFYSSHDVFATYTRIFSSIQLLVNEEFFHQSSFYLIKTSFISPASISATLFITVGAIGGGYWPGGYGLLPTKLASLDVYPSKGLILLICIAS